MLYYVILIVITVLVITLLVILFKPLKNDPFPGGTVTSISPEEIVIFRIAIPRNNDKTPLAAGQLFGLSMVYTKKVALFQF